jgi:hypothetical protein
VKKIKSTTKRKLKGKTAEFVRKQLMPSIPQLMAAYNQLLEINGHLKVANNALVSELSKTLEELYIRLGVVEEKLFGSPKEPNKVPQTENILKMNMSEEEKERFNMAQAYAMKMLALKKDPPKDTKPATHEELVQALKGELKEQCSCAETHGKTTE